MLKKIIALLLVLMALVALASTIPYVTSTPTHERQWAVEHTKLPLIQFNGDPDNPQVTIQNLRDFRWQNNNPEHYTQRSFKLSDIMGVKAGVSHFAPLNNIAHVFIVFVTQDGEEIGVSIEARREIDETFSIQGGLFAQFEIIYVVATAKDLIDVRADERLYLFPIKTTPQRAQKLFQMLAEEVNIIHNTPQTYHLLAKNCTNQLTKHVSKLTQKKYSWYFQTIAPGLTGYELFKHGLIDTQAKDYETAKQEALYKK